MEGGIEKIGKNPSNNEILLKEMLKFSKNRKVEEQELRQLIEDSKNGKFYEIHYFNENVIYIFKDGNIIKEPMEPETKKNQKEKTEEKIIQGTKKSLLALIDDYEKSK